MTDQEKIKALAELGGFKTYQQINTLTIYCSCVPMGANWKQRDDLWSHPDNATHNIPDYLHSYDAIIPVIKGCWQAQKFEAHKFYAALENYYPHALLMITDATPAQLCDALLSATGKMK